MRKRHKTTKARYYQRMELVDCVKNIFSDRIYKAKLTEPYTLNMADILCTITIRELQSKNISIGKNRRENELYVLDLLTEDFFTEVISKYKVQHVKDKYDTLGIVKVQYVRMITNLIFGYNIGSEQVGINYDYEVKCYCGCDAEFKEDFKQNITRGLGNGDERTVIHSRYECPKCGNYVYTHEYTKIPYGIPSNGYNRFLRVKVHEMVNEICVNPERIKYIYNEMKRLFPEREFETGFHIGYLNIEECEKCINYLSEEYGISSNIKKKEDDEYEYC